MKAWTVALVALIVGAGAVIASLLFVRPDRTAPTSSGSSPVSGEPSFTVIDDTPNTTPSPTPTNGDVLITRAGEAAEPQPTATGSRRRSTVRVQSGEIEESSTDQKLEEEEDERKLEESEDRAKAREKRRDRDD